ncbi:MAG: hypothetical protein VYA30_08795 [Myxococcota bacterium]|nr:hypothetical protein [Myxococcota bacterium]
MYTRPFNIVLLWLCCLVPSVASADLLSAWIAGKGNYIQGTGDVFSNLNKDFAFGGEVGVELLGIEAFGEGFIMGGDEFMLTANLGTSFDFDLGARLSIGGYLSAMIFKFPDAEAESLNISTELRGLLGDDLTDQLVTAYDDNFAETAGELSEWAVGVGPRVRVQLDYPILPVFYIGLEASYGYHWMLSGDDVNGTAKSEAIKAFIEENPQAAQFETQLREAVGAEDIDPDDMNGTNYQVGVFLKLDL